jgi:hypothetical protein
MREKFLYHEDERLRKEEFLLFLMRFYISFHFFTLLSVTAKFADFFECWPIISIYHHFVSLFQYSVVMM